MAKRPSRSALWRTSRESGLATVMMFVLLVLVSACVLANLRTLSHLKSEIRLIDQRQEQSRSEEAHRVEALTGDVPVRSGESPR
jgi:hypothetical protein